MIGTYPFKDYEQFKELFVREDGRRKNAVLLKFVMSKDVRHWCIEHDYVRALRIKSMPELRSFVLRMMRNYPKRGCRYSVEFMDDWYYSDEFYSDSNKGICEDRDYRAYRYCRADSGRVFKMKAGRLFMRLIDCSEIGVVLPNEVKLWMCEEMQAEWEGFSRSKLPPLDEVKLHVDDDFAKIYSGRNLLGDFGSCMTNRDHHYFYEYHVKAKAAYIENNEGKILSRCVIFTEVRDEDTGEIFRLAERQYSSGSQDCLKYDLVRMLIDGGHIDGYKKIGAGCSDASAFVFNNGEHMCDRRLSIECNVDYDSIISYQDSFKWYDMSENRAYNFYKRGADIGLDTTDERIEGGNYDEYHDCYTSSDLVSVYVDGRWMDCDEDRLDDFVYVEGEGYVHMDDVEYCPHCDEPFLPGFGEYSTITGESYCCMSCMEDAEHDYKEENWHYSEYDDDYFEDEDDITTLKRGSDDEITISVDSAESLVVDGEAICVDGRFYTIEFAREALTNY